MQSFAYYFISERLIIRGFLSFIDVIIFSGMYLIKEELALGGCLFEIAFGHYLLILKFMFVDLDKRLSVSYVWKCQFDCHPDQRFFFVVLNLQCVLLYFLGAHPRESFYVLFGVLLLCLIVFSSFNIVRGVGLASTRVLQE